jgi:uncharacterized delta-60 repeat protein
MFGTFRSRMRTCRPLFIPVTVLALMLSPHTRIALHAAAGDLDPTFGTGGIVTTDFGNTPDDGQEVAVQPDGKIVVAGYRGSDFAVARYNVDGSLDATFGTGGLVVTDLYGNSRDIAGGMALQPDGKIVLAGQTSTPAITVTDQDFALVRYNSDGSLDSTSARVALFAPTSARRTMKARSRSRSTARAASSRSVARSSPSHQPGATSRLRATTRTARSTRPSMATAA